jgi:DNA (cytosine-5)-methyltransferase 1
MTHGSLFSGIGGFDLAAEWMGWENKFHCEWNEFGQKVLKHYWPEAESFHDITKTDFTKYANRIDILTGGFPCQPYSMAGKRKGKEDERHLWPEMLRCIREVKPKWVVGENVLGLVNWSGGLVFHEVQSDLEAEGYEVFPYVLPAASINASHRRDRIFFIAYSNDNGCYKYDCKSEVKSNIGRFNAFDDINEMLGERTSTNTNCERYSRATSNGIQEMERIATQQYAISTRSHKRTDWLDFPTVSPICDGDDGLSNRLDSITFSKWRRETIKAGGNAVVPQLIYVLFKTIQQYESRTN